jgi:hypothetical protein
MYKQLIALTGLFAFCLAAGPATTTSSSAARRPLASQYRDPETLAFSAIRRVNAEIYVGKLADHALDAANDPSARIEYGRVTVDVSKVIRGDKTSKLTMPYSFENPQFGGRGIGVSPVWPDPAGMDKGTWLLLVVVQDGYDYYAGDKMPDLPSAAQLVCKLTGPDDPTVAAYERIVQTESLKGQELVTALMDEVGDKNTSLRQYAVYAAGGIPSKDRATVLNQALENERRLLPVLQDRNRTIGAVLQGFPENLSPNDTKRILAEFVKLTQSNDPDERDFYVQQTQSAILRNNQGLISVTPRADTPRPKSAAELLDSAQAAQLRKAATASLESPNAPIRASAANVLRWLGAATTQSTTQGS